MKFYGNINLSQNKLQNAALEIETELPAVPVVGRLAFVNKVFYICVDVTGSPVWVPLTNEINAYEFDQSSPSTTWVINHNINTLVPVVQIYGTDGLMVMPNEITIVSANQVNVLFSTPFSGKAVVIAGSLTGIQSTGSGGSGGSANFIYTAESALTTHTVVHNLNQDFVNVTVYNALTKSVVIADVHSDNANQITVTCSPATQVVVVVG